MSRFNRVSMWALALGVIGFATGCPEAGPKIYSVTGKVTIGGQPAKDVTVNFVGTVSGKELLASGMVTNGTYELLGGSDGKKGVPAGKYKVYLSSNAQASMESVAESMKNAKNGPPPPPPAPYPAQYADAQTSGLEFEVKSAPNTIDITVP